MEWPAAAGGFPPHGTTRSQPHVSRWKRKSWEEKTSSAVRPGVGGGGEPLRWGPWCLGPLLWGAQPLCPPCAVPRTL